MRGYFAVSLLLITYQVAGQSTTSPSFTISGDSTGVQTDNTLEESIQIDNSLPDSLSTENVKKLLKEAESHSNLPPRIPLLAGLTEAGP